MWKTKLSIGAILSLVCLLVIPFAVFAADPPNSDWQVTDITVDNEWITSQAGTPDATPEATNKTTITVTVKNNNNGSSEPTLGRVQSEGVWIDLSGLQITGDPTSIQPCNKGNTATYHYYVTAASYTQEGMADMVVMYEGQQGLQVTIFGHTYVIWGDWITGPLFIPFLAEPFCGDTDNLFGVDSTSPTAVVTVSNHGTNDSAWGLSHTWQSADITVLDNLSGIASVEKTVSTDGKTVTFTITDKAGNITIKEVELRESWSFPSIALCENCWHSLAGVGDMSGTGVFTVFAAGGWVYYTCPFCKFSNEKAMRNAYKTFVERGGYVPLGDFYHGMNYRP